MDRFDIIQQIIEAKNSRNYLEIGVEKGKVFLKIKARKKIAVDPAFKIRLKKKIRACLANPMNLFNEYYEMTSDDFFEKHGDRLRRLNGLDIAFVDGLHTYGQTLKDIVNCLKFLAPGGVIAVHDCNPETAASAVPAESREQAANLNIHAQTNDWSGDVWKAIVNLRSNRDDLKICVLDCDHGVAIITRGPADSLLDLSAEKIEHLDFDDLNNNRQNLLNLKPPHYLQDFLSSTNGVLLKQED